MSGIDKDNDKTKQLLKPSTTTMAGSRYRMKTSLEDVRSLLVWKSVFAEFIGTFLLVLTGLGSTVQGWQEDSLDIVQIALCFGLSVATSVWIVGHISGGHINPAVTIAMLVTRRISLLKAIVFFIVQCLGSIAAAAVLRGLTPETQLGSLGCTTLGAEMTPGKGVAIEFFITTVLVLTVFASCDSNRNDLGGSFPLTIGLSVTMCHLWAVYWIGPLAGGIVAGLLYDYVLARNASVLKGRDCLMSADFDDEKYTPRKTKVILLDEDIEEINL